MGWQWLALLLFCGCCLGWPAPLAAGECQVEIAASRLARPTGAGEEVIRAAYALAGSGEVPVYARPEDEAAGEVPVRFLPAGYIGVSLVSPEPVRVNGGAWLRINPNEYVRAADLEPAVPSRHQGIFVPDSFQTTFAWVLFNSQASRAPGEAPAAEALFLPERALVFVHELREVGGEKWCRIGCGWWLPYRRLALVVRQPRPAAIGARERWLHVSLLEQTLAAYEGDRLVFATLVSAGKQSFPTAEGLFRIYYKVGIRKMSGGEGADYYHLEDVPWQMYFYEGYALHGSYWHDLLGIPTSHGCVNLSPADARWLYGWSGPQPRAGRNEVSASRRNPGTWVWVHE